jgi:hypothetical protein
MKTQRRTSSKRTWVTAFAVLMAGCGSSEGQGSSNPFGAASPVECGTLTCSATEICIIRESGPFMDPAEDTYSCEPAPSGCDPASLCDCPAAEGNWGADPITGCSLLGERSLYVTDVTCGAAPCTASEVCVVTGSPFSNPIGPRSCAPLPTDCAPGEDFCDTDCGDRAASALGKTKTGCVGADWAVGIYVNE